MKQLSQGRIPAPELDKNGKTPEAADKMLSEAKRVLDSVDDPRIEAGMAKMKDVKRCMVCLRKVMPPLESMAMLGEVDEKGKSHDSLLGEIAAVITATKRLYEVCVESKAIITKCKKAPAKSFG